MSPIGLTTTLDIDALGRPAHAAGVSLAELLVSLAVLGLLLGATVSLVEQGQRLHGAGAARVEAQQSARIALERMAREIRGAGWAPGGGIVPAISVATRTEIVLHFDLNGDGVIAGNGETVTWRLDGRILRRNAGGGAQPVINGVRDLALSYLDASGAPTTVPGDVWTVGITLVTEPDDLSVDPARRALATMSTQVRLRNR